MNKKTTFLFFISFSILVIVLNSTISKKEDFSQRRTGIMNELSLAVEDATANGDYKCCIDPPCTMCYLGNWLWNDGTCHCDEMILKGEFDKVCPQCKKGLEKGLCKSTADSECNPL